MENTALGMIHCAGVDAEKFLQGQLSANMSALTETQGALACYLNLKGRVVALIYVIKHANGYGLILPQDLLHPLLNKLKKFIAFSKATLTDVSDHYAISGVIGEPVSAPAYSVAIFEENIIFNLSPSHGLSLHIAAGNGNGVLSHDFLKAMFEAGIPWIGLAQSEKFLPHYINLVTLGAIAFDKGCFVGQEIVARMQYRGHLNKALVFEKRDDITDDAVNRLEIDGAVWVLYSR